MGFGGGFRESHAFFSGRDVLSLSVRHTAHRMSLQRHRHLHSTKIPHEIERLNKTEQKYETTGLIKMAEVVYVGLRSHRVIYQNNTVCVCVKLVL